MRPIRARGAGPSAVGAALCILAPIAALGLGARGAHAAERPAPGAVPIVHASDVASLAPAELGRPGILDAVGIRGEAILVSPGGALEIAGAAAVAGPGAAVDLLEAASFDVVNLAARDLAGDLNALAAALRRPGVRFVSASFRLRAPAETPWKPFAVVERGGTKVAFVGVAERSPALEAAGGGLPGGLEFVEPREALERALAAASREAPRAVVLADGTLSGLGKFVLEVPGIDAAIVSSRGLAGPESGLGGKLFLSPAGGEAVAVLAGEGAARASRSVALPRARRPSPLVAEILARHDLAIPKPDLARPAGAESAGLAREVGRGAFAPVAARAKNRAAEIEVRSIGIFERFAGVEAPEGRALLAVATRWKNILPPEEVRDRQVPVAYRIPKISDHVYCVADGTRNLPHAGAPSEAFEDGKIELPGPGSAAEGTILYEIDAARVPARLDFHVFDFAHGSVSLRLLEAPGSPDPAALSPVVPLEKNEVVEAGVFSLRREDPAGDVRVAPDEEIVAFELLARSLVEFPADATAYDPKARPGAKIAIGTVADWAEARDHIQLIVDGECARVPRDAGGLRSDIEDAPRFLPGILTGGTLRFRVPRERVSLELLCEFPNASLPGRAGTIRPKPLRFALEGKPPAPEKRPAVASVEDGKFRVSVLGARAEASFAGAAAEEGERFLVAEVLLENGGEEAEIFQPFAQLRHVSEDGEQGDADLLSLEGPRPAAERLRVPPGERRRFELAYRIAGEETRPRIAYAGWTLARVLDLPPVAARPVGGEELAERVEEPEGPAEPEEPEKPEEPAAERGAPPTVAEGKAEPAPEEAREPEEPPPAKPRAVEEPRREPRGLAGVGLTPEDVNRAIDRGAEFLWKLVRDEDVKKGRQKFGDMEEHYLASLALVHSGAHRKFPDFDAALRGLLAKYDPLEEGVYVAGVVGMTVEAYGDPSLYGALERVVRYLLDAQGERGAWDYRGGAKVLSEPARVLEVLGGLPPGGRSREELSRAVDWKLGSDGDNSVTQFALLGLHAASRSGYRIWPETWKRALAETVRRQSRDGGWAYTTGGSYGSMTAAGVCALAICRHELGVPDYSKMDDLLRGRAWLAKHFTVEENPESSDWQYYYLYSIERAGRLLDTEFIGEHEWYPTGARWLIDHQRPDGGWVGPGSERDPRLATSFALLFLTRATPTLRREKGEGDGILKTGADLGPAVRYYFILDASGSMLEEIEGREKMDVARRAVAGIVGELPDAAEVALRVYGHRKRALDPGADEDTELVIPLRKLEREAFLAQLAKVRARGKTPLARSLTDARRDLAGATRERPVKVILLTDGGEDTRPRGDPVAAAEALGKMRGIEFHVIGFDIGREDWSAQLLAMAERGKGRYWPAADARRLEAEVRAAVLGVPSGFDVLGAGGALAWRGRFGESRSLPPGAYRLRTEYGGTAYEEEFWVNPGEVTSIVFRAWRASRPPAEGGAAPEGTDAEPEGEPEPAAEEAPPEKGPAAAAFCTQCGGRLKPGDRFCSSCGAPVKR